MRFPVVQFEFTHAVGPAEGRYAVRGTAGGPPDRGPDEPPPSADPEAIGAGLEVGTADVVVFQRLGARTSRRRPLAQRVRECRRESEPREVSVLRVTVVKATRMLDAFADSEAFLARLRARPERAQAWIDDGLAILNRAIGAHRICAADPFAVGVTHQDARVARVGYGTGELVFEGMWEKAIEVPAARAPRLRREQRLLPQGTLAAMLADNAPMLEGEELVLRVALDIDQGRLRAAAVGLSAAVPLVLSELDGYKLDAATERRIEALSGACEDIEALADRARAPAPLNGTTKERLAELVQQVGGVLDGWRYGEQRHGR